MIIKGISEVIRTLENIQKQARFASAQALNDTAREVQQFTIGQSSGGGYLADKFTLRTGRGVPWWRQGNRFSFNIKRATKDNLSSIVGSQAPWLEAQEHGGTRQRVAIPTTKWKPKPEALLRGKKVKQLLAGRIPPGLSAHQRAFIVQRAMAGPGVFVRTEDGRHIMRLFTFESYTHVKAILGWEPRAAALAAEIFPKHFDRRFAQALATAK